MKSGICLIRKRLRRFRAANRCSRLWRKSFTSWACTSARAPLREENISLHLESKWIGVPMSIKSGQKWLSHNALQYNGPSYTIYWNEAHQQEPLRQSSAVCVFLRKVSKVGSAMSWFHVISKVLSLTLFWPKNLSISKISITYQSFKTSQRGGFQPNEDGSVLSQSHLQHVVVASWTNRNLADAALSLRGLNRFPEKLVAYLVATCCDMLPHSHSIESRIHSNQSGGSKAFPKINPKYPKRNWKK